MTRPNGAVGTHNNRRFLVQLRLIIDRKRRAKTRNESAAHSEAHFSTLCHAIRRSYRSNTASRKRVLYSHSNTRTADRFSNYPRLLGSFCIKKSISPRWKLTCVYWGVAFPQRLYYLRLENAIPSAQYYGCPVAAGQLIQSQEQLHRMKRGSRIGFHCSGGNCQMHSN